MGHSCISARGSFPWLCFAARLMRLIQKPHKSLVSELVITFVPTALASTDPGKPQIAHFPAPQQELLGLGKGK